MSSLYIDNQGRIQPVSTWLEKYFCNPKNTPMCQVIFSFFIGLLLSPWSYGIFFVVISIIIYELLFYFFTKGNPLYFNSFVRTSVVCSYVLGYITGRTLSGDEILYGDAPDMVNYDFMFE